MSENPATITLPHADWELLMEFVKVNANRQELEPELWQSWGNEITRLVREQLPSASTASVATSDEPVGC